MGSMLMTVLVMGSGLVIAFLYQRKMATQVKNSTNEEVGAIARRTGLEMAQGDPSLNLLYLTTGRPDQPVRLRGTPYGRPVAFDLTNSYEPRGCVLSLALSAPVPDFEVTLRRPSHESLIAHRALAGAPGHFEVSIHNPQLDSLFRVVSSDARVGPVLGESLSLMAAHSFVHVLGQNGRLETHLTPYGLSYFTYGAEEQLWALESMACALEGKPAPGRRNVTAGAPWAAPAGAEVIPIPCSRCGASMGEEAARGDGPIHGQIQARCRFCGNVEPLPPDLEERTRFLRQRLLQLRNSQRGVEAPALQVKMILEHQRFALVACAMPLVLGVGSAMTSSRGYHGLVEGGMSVFHALALTILPIAMTAAVAVGLLAGYFGMAAKFRRSVLPLLAARPPLGPSGQARCRSCGGPLAITQASSIECSHCKAPNFLSEDLAQRSAELLALETREYHRRAENWGRTVTHPYASPVHAFFLWGAAGAASTVALGGVVTLVAWLLIR